MLAGDMAVLDELCSDHLISPLSNADYDDKRSYLHKVGSATLPTSRSTIRRTTFWLSMRRNKVTGQYAVVENIQ